MHSIGDLLQEKKMVINIMKLPIVLVSLLALELKAQEHTSEELSRAQLEAYNNGDLEAFLKPYSDSVKIYNFPNTLIGKGKRDMRKNYGNMFELLADLHCTLVNRMVSGNTVIDHESVVFHKDQPPMEAFASYKIANGKIQEVYFIRPDK